MRRAAVVLAFGLLLAAPVFAHHPFEGEYNWKQPDTVVGSVTRIEWKEPHVMLILDGKDDHAKSGEWRIELGGPVDLAPYGWSVSTLRPGQRVSVDGWLAKNGSQQLNAKSVTPENGKAMFAASSFYNVGPAPVATSGVK
jgi:hypothetical protein